MKNFEQKLLHEIKETTKETNPAFRSTVKDMYSLFKKINIENRMSIILKKNGR